MRMVLYHIHIPTCRATIVHHPELTSCSIAIQFFRITCTYKDFAGKSMHTYRDRNNLWSKFSCIPRIIGLL